MQMNRISFNSPVLPVDRYLLLIWYFNFLLLLVVSFFLTTILVCLKTQAVLQAVNNDQTKAAKIVSAYLPANGINANGISVTAASLALAQISTDRVFICPVCICCSYF